MKPRSVLAFGKRMEIYNFMTTVCKEIGGGYCQYIEPWSDYAVAEKFRVSVGNISGIRKPIGKLRDHRSSAKLEERVTHIEEYLTRKGGYQPLDRATD